MFERIEVDKHSKAVEVQEHNIGNRPVLVLWLTREGLAIRLFGQVTGTRFDWLAEASFYMYRWRF